MPNLRMTGTGRGRRAAPARTAGQADPPLPLPCRRRRAAPTALAFAAVLAVGVTSLVGVSAAGAADAPDCQPRTSGGPLFVTATCVDPALNQPYTDIDEQRTTTDPTTKVTVTYRYIHGGFTGTNAKFSLYFPAAAQYRGRFFESTYPTVTQEDATPDVIAFAISNGAYVVSTNNGGGVAAAGGLGGYRVNAASAKYSRVVAARVYQGTARPRGYIYGASGGAYQTLGAMENTDGVWDGGVPMVPGVPNGIPSFQASQSLALRILADKLPQIADAVAPGGSGDPYKGLNPTQRQVLQEVTRLGFPLRGWWQYATLNGGSFSVVARTVRAMDPSYVNDFWAAPGYEGSSDAAVKAARVQYDTTVTGLVGSPTSALTLSGVPGGDVGGADLVVTSGAAAGKSVPIGTVTGTTVGFGFGADPAVTGAIKPGDEVRIDNSWLLALQYYQRHQVPSSDQYGWNQYRGPNGDPLYPQRPILVGPRLAAGAGGAAPTGHFNGKMIMLASTMDTQAYPWSADWYHKQASTALGGKLADRYRLWYMDNAEHGPDLADYTSAIPGAAAHIVGYRSALNQALLDLDAWVVRGTRPPASTTYTVDGNTQVNLPAAAAQRNGVQPVVTLSANNANSGHPIDVRVGQQVTFSVQAQVPPGAGKIVRTEWDFLGAGDYPITATNQPIEAAEKLRATYSYSKPGTYFPVVRVTSQRDGNSRTPYGLIQNLAAVRIVVH